MSKSSTGFALLPMNAAGLCFNSGDRQIIDHLDLKLNAETLSVIMGPNGAGKSVLLRLLHGLLRPSAGQISWGNLGNPNEARIQQAMVFQQPVLLRRSVNANLEFVLKISGRNKNNKGNKEYRDALLDQVGLLALARQPARSLSGGEQQRLALARALATRPSVLFLDEPSASLDPASVMMIEKVVLDSHRNGTKCILVTHDVGQARRLADEVIFLHHGRLLEQSPAGVFFDKPRSDAALAYLQGRIVL